MHTGTGVGEVQVVYVCVCTASHCTFNPPGAVKEVTLPNF